MGDLLFYALCLGMLGCAAVVVTSRNLFRSVLAPSISPAMFAPIPEGAPNPLDLRNSPMDVLPFIL
jgi:hypothetical protein